MAVVLSLLGSFHATVDGHAVTEFRSDKARALLAYLAVEVDRPHRRDSLAVLLWPEHSDAAAHLNLRQTLFRLRRVLQSPKPEALIVTRTTAQFNQEGGHDSDAATFAALMERVERHAHDDAIRCPECLGRRQQAVALYKGPLLAGLSLPDSDPFEVWRLMCQEQFHQQVLRALHDLTLYHEENKEYHLAQQYALRQITLEPWREVAHQQLMRALALSGQWQAALAQYERYVQILREELDMDPDPETTALYQTIMEGELVPPRGCASLWWIRSGE
jgi:DNA-binding SARP family transcriptional activator